MVLRLSHWWFSIASLAFGQAVVSIFSNIDYVGGITGFVGIPLKTGSWSIYGVLGLLILALLGLEKSRFNLGIRAISSDEIAAMTSGVNSKMVRICAFTIGSFIAGVGGGLQIHLLSVITPLDMSFHVSLNYFINVAVGGTGNFWGTLIASYVLFLLPELLRFSAADRFILFGILLVIIMIFLPQGIMGQRVGWGNLLGKSKRESKR
jgi:branched-chain amino acid transport system permease protein